MTWRPGRNLGVAGLGVISVSMSMSSIWDQSSADQGHKRLSRQIAEPPCLAGACFYRIGSAPSESSNMEKITPSKPPSAIFGARNSRKRTAPRSRVRRSARQRAGPSPDNTYSRYNWHFTRDPERYEEKPIEPDT